MKNKTLKAILLVSLLLNFFMLAGAGYFLVKDGRCGALLDRPSRGHGALVEKLNLSPEQKKAMEAGDAMFRKDIEGARKELSEKREKLFALIKADVPDRSAMRTVIADISALQGEIEVHVIEHLLNEKAVLDKEQQEQYLKLLEKRFNRARHREMRPGLTAPGR